AHRGQAAANADDARLVVGVVRELGRSYRFLRFGFAIATGAAFVATVWWATVGTTRWLLVSVGVTAVGAAGLLLDIRRRKRMTLAERLNLELLDRGIR
ncbi:MAG TPA: hypothetical protein VG709_07090, partial [Actinomycetota bacterium]|nr:hypothetical protein [Actinomycetota bacterium]